VERGCEDDLLSVGILPIDGRQKIIKSIGTTHQAFPDTQTFPEQHMHHCLQAIRVQSFFQYPRTDQDFLFVAEFRNFFINGAKAFPPMVNIAIPIPKPRRVQSISGAIRKNRATP
jgi:hypothetical protein